MIVLCELERVKANYISNNYVLNKLVSVSSAETVVAELPQSRPLFWNMNIASSARFNLTLPLLFQRRLSWGKDRATLSIIIKEPWE